MHEYYDNKLKKQTINLAPGEFYVSRDDITINTVLGSCVAVVLYDPVLKAGGLNHFMLADAKLKIDLASMINVERYGLYAMEALLNGLIKLGCQKSRLQAKVFGGSAVLETSNFQMAVGADNIRFAEEYLKTENIPIMNRDTGGEKARRIYFFPQTFRVLLRRVKVGDELSTAMSKYKINLEKKKKTDGDAVIF